jgi:hypothetical protein
MTMKRPFEVLNGSPHHDHSSPLAKRKRCGPPLQPSVLSTSPAKVKRLKRVLESEEEGVNRPSPPSSPFRMVTSPIDSDKLSISLESELKRYHKRKLFTNEDPPSPGSSDGPLFAGNGSGMSGCGGGRNKEQPLFTLRQVVMVCQRKLKEREEELREEYDKVLSAKLAEQYDAFVRFSRDQIEKRYSNEDMSYVS